MSSKNIILDEYYPNVDLPEIGAVPRSSYMAMLNNISAFGWSCSQRDIGLISYAADPE